MSTRPVTEEEKSIIVEADQSKDTSMRSPVKGGHGSQPANWPHLGKDEGKTNKTGYLKVGDIIFLKVTVDQEKTHHRFMLSSDGILSNFVDCIPKTSDNKLVKGANVLTRSCLFRIENARTVIKVKDERKEDDSEYRMALGKPFTYGEHIQLRHFHSRGFLGVSATEIALEQGCLRVEVTPESSEFTWFEVLPVNKLRQQGEKIKYSDSVYLRAVGLRTDYYLHIFTSSMDSGSDKLEVNCSPEECEWKPRCYMVFNEIEGEQKYVTTSNSFRIYHRISEGYLVAKEMPLLEPEADKLPDVFVEKGNKTSSSLWELQRTATFSGGKAGWKDRFRVKHLATGLFLSDQKTLMADGGDQQFILEPDAEDASELISFGSILCFQSVRTGEYMKVEVPEDQLSTKIKVQSSDSVFPVTWTNSKKNYPNLAFCIEDVQENLTDHVYKLALMVPAIVDFYSFVKQVNTADSLKSAGGVTRIMEECKKTDNVLSNISTQIIHKNDVGVDIFQRQDSMREMGIIDALVELGKAIDSLTGNLHQQRFSSSSRLVADDKDAIVKACFDPVEKRLFRVVHEAIKSNEKSCVRMHIYEDYLLSPGKLEMPEVSQLLKEVFRFARVQENVDEDRFDRWFRRPDRPEADLSIEEMVLNLNIISSLCERGGKGVAKYQMMVHRYLLEAKNEFPLIKFSSIMKKPCLELIFKTERHEEVFLECDSAFSQFEQPRLRQTLSSKAPGQCCFYLEDLCKIPLIAKFLTAELSLYVNICLDRNSKMISVMTKDLTLTNEHAESVLLNTQLPDKVRAAYASLYKVVFIDIDPYYSCQDDLSRCYQYEEATLMKAKTRVNDGKPENEFEGITRIIRRFWYYDGLVSLDGQHLGQKLEITTSFLRLTRALVELNMDIGEEKHKFIEILMQPLSLLLMERVPNAQSELMKHWCCKMMLEVKDTRSSGFKISLENKWGDVIYEVLLILEVVLKHRQDLHITQFLSKFKEVFSAHEEEVIWHDQFPALKEDFTEILHRLDFDIKFRGQHKEAVGCASIMDLQLSNSPDTDILDLNASDAETEVQETNVLALDLYLLQLVFNVGKSRKKKIRKKALDIIIQNMNEKKRLKDQLQEVQFLIGPQMTTQFRHMLDLREVLRTRVKVLQEAKWLEEDLKDKDRYNQIVGELIAAINEAVKQLTVPEESKFLRTKLQDIMRQSSLHLELINILYVDYELSRDSRLLFERTFDVLRLFILNNKKNQSLMFAHKDRLLSLMEFQEGGVTHLLTEVLRSYRDTEFGMEVIKYLFVLIERPDDYPYKLLQLLRTFTVDESGVYIKNIQIDILKGIVSSVKIVNLHQQKIGTINYTQPQYDKSAPEAGTILRFHLEVIRSLIACTYTNRFGLLQCRKLISSSVLKKVIRHDTNLTCKKTYLRYLYQVYMTSLEGDVAAVVTVNDLEELLKDIEMNLADSIRRFPELIKLAKTGVYDNVRVRLNDSRSARPLLLEFGSSVVEPGDEDKRSVEYWNYLSGKETVHTEKDGLLHILRDMFSTTVVTVSAEIMVIAGEMDRHLRMLSKGIRAEEAESRDLDFANLQLVVNACREVLPCVPGAESAARVPMVSEDSDSEEGEEMSKLVSVIREYVIIKNISFEQAFDLFDVNRDGSISVAELKAVLRTLMQGNIRDVDLGGAIRYLDKDGDGNIQFDEFTSKLKKYFSRHSGRMKTVFKDISLNALPQMNEKLTDDQSRDQRYKESLKEFNEEFAGHFPDIDIQPLINKVHKEFVEPSLKRKDFTVFRDFISKLGEAFNKRAHKIYLIKMLRMLVRVQPGETADEEARVNKIKEIQIVLCEAEVLKMALGILSDVSDLELVNETVELLLAMLQGGNIKVQEAMLLILKQESDAHLFSYIRSQLRLSRDRIVGRANKIYVRNPELAMAEMIGEADLNEENEVCEELTHDEEAHSDHVVNLLKLIQLCCENCYADFQHYIRTQNEGTGVSRQLSIGLVNELAQYLINLKEVGRQLRNDYEAAKVVPSCLEALIDICKGPCLKNQQLLGTKKKLYKFINSCIQIDLRKTFKIGQFSPLPGSQAHSRTETEARFFISSIRLLKALLEGEYDHKVAEMMLSVINFRELALKAKEIYELFVHDRLRLFMQDRFEGEEIKSSFLRFLKKISPNKNQQLTFQDWEIIDLGFDICIIILKLRTEFANEDLKWLNFSDRVPHSTSHLDQSFFLARIDAFKGRSESVLSDLYYLYSEVRAFLSQSYKTQNMMDLAYSFYLSLIGTVEVDRGGKLTQCYFRFPTMVSFMSTKIMRAVTLDVNRNSHDEKIKSFFYKCEKYEISMAHLQFLSRIRPVSVIASKRYFVESVCFVLIVIFNIFMLFTITSADNAAAGMRSIGSTAFMTAFAVVLSVLAISVYLLYILENYPMIVYDKEHKAMDEGAYENKALSKLKGTILMKEMAQYNRGVGKGERLPRLMKLIYILTYYENVYNLAYVLISFAALENPFFYAILLLDIIRRSEDLVNILRSITENKKQLILTLILGIVIVFLFSVAGFLWFGEYFIHQSDGAPKTTYCHTLLQCFASEINMGVRAGGGIGDVLGFPTIEQSTYWYRQIYDILFFIIISTVLLNIIFGIIIDTFAELRDKRKFIENDMKTVCFICGRQLYEFEFKGSGWYEHIQTEHNLYAYLAFIIYVRRRPLQECDGLEKYVKKRIAQNDVSFFPKTAISLESQNEEEKSALTSVKEELQTLAKELKSGDAPESTVVDKE